MSGGVRRDAIKRLAESADLAALIAAHEAASDAWQAAKTYEDAAFDAFKRASTELLLAYAAQERAS